MNKSLLGVFCVTLCYVCWGILPIFWTNMNFLDSSYIMGIRIIWSSIFYILLVAYEKKLHMVPAILKNKKQCLFVFITGLALTLNWWIYIYAVTQGKIIETSLAYYINPMLAILVGAFFFREKLKPAQWVAVSIAAVGIIYSVVAYGSLPTSAIFIGISFVIYGTMKKISTIDPDVSLMLETVFMIPFALVYLLYAETAGTGYIGQLTVWQYLMFPAAGFATAVPLVLYARGIDTTPLSLSGVLMFLNPTLQILVALVVYGEHFKDSDYVMFPCVWLGVIIFIASNISTYRKTHAVGR